jgi:hypothetical protein
MNDALGNPLVVGNKYGYSTRKDGWTSTVVGVLSNIGATKSTLTGVVRREFLYGKATEGWHAHAKTTSVSPQLLFPVSE